MPRHSHMWYATTTRIAASVAIGISPAQRPAPRVITSNVSACVIPATGVRPPFFTFVAVRAIAPVAGIPPNSGATRFAAPWATSSMFDRWRPPIMPSETTAESSDSTAPRSAMVNAGAISDWICASERCGRCGCGIDAAMAPKRDPIVSTGRCISFAATVMTTSATNGPGIRRLIFGQIRMIASDSAPTTAADGVTPFAWANATHLPMKSGGTAPI